MEVRVIHRSSTRAVPGARAGRIQASWSLCSHGAWWLHSLGGWSPELGSNGGSGQRGRVHRDVVGFLTTGIRSRVDPFSVLAHSAGAVKMPSLYHCGWGSRSSGPQCWKLGLRFKPVLHDSKGLPCGHLLQPHEDCPLREATRSTCISNRKH